LYVTVKMLLTNLSPDTFYRIEVAAATESIAYPGEYFKGPYSPAKDIKTLGELLLILYCFFVH